MDRFGAEVPCENDESLLAWVGPLQVFAGTLDEPEQFEGLKLGQNDTDRIFARQAGSR